MSQTKYRLPDDLKSQCISLVRGYKRRVRLYHDRQTEAIHRSPPSPDGLPRGYDISDSTPTIAAQLEAIESMYDTAAMRAVEQAKLCIGDDLADEPRRRLTGAVWESCMDGRNFIFSHHDLTVGKDSFYERRRKFLYKIAELMHFV